MFFYNSRRHFKEHTSTYSQESCCHGGKITTADAVHQDGSSHLRDKAKMRPSTDRLGQVQEHNRSPQRKRECPHTVAPLKRNAFIYKDKLVHRDVLGVQALHQA